MKSLSKMSLGLLSVLALGSTSFHHRTTVESTTQLCEGIAPPNTLHRPVVHGFDATGIDQDTFNKVIADFEAIYAPIVQAHGATLVVNNLWDDDTVNSNTTVDENNNWVINAYGGLARYEGINYDAYMAVLCHEMGHHLGGFPFKDDNTSWASDEGEADYFATMKGFGAKVSAASNKSGGSTRSKITSWVSGNPKSTRANARPSPVNTNPTV